MGSDRKSGSGGDNVGIPPAAKKIVSNLREIVNYNCSDSEIYAVLRECDMDPNDAVQRLLSQDTFHEVKSKRERRKEMKETQDFKTRVGNATSNRSVRIGNELAFGRSGPPQISSNDQGKGGYRRENGSVASVPNTASSTTWATGKVLNDQSDSLLADSRRQLPGTGDMLPSSVQPSSGSWMGTTSGQVSMADIVRMGRPQSKGSQTLYETPHVPPDALPPNSVSYIMKSSNVSSPSLSERHQELHQLNSSITHEHGKTHGHRDFDNEWPGFEQIAAVSGSCALETSATLGGEVYSSQPHLHSDIGNLSRNYRSDEIQVLERGAARLNLNSDYSSSTQVSSTQIMVNGIGETDKHSDNVPRSMSSSNSHRHVFEHQHGVGKGSDISRANHSASLSDDIMRAVSSTSQSLQQINLGKGPAVPSTEDKGGVVLPNHLQAFAADCSHLSFGTYNSGKSNISSRQQVHSTLTEDLKEGSAVTDDLATGQLECRNSVYHGEEQLGFTYNAHGIAANVRNFGTPKSSNSELMRQDVSEAAYRPEYMPQSVSDSGLKNLEQLSASLPFMSDPNTRNISALLSEMQTSSSSIPSNLLAAAVQSLRARDSMAYLGTQSMPPGYSGEISSINTPNISLSEVINPGAFSVSRQSVDNLAAESVLQDNLLQPYSQMRYRAAPQNHMYVPSALPHGFPNDHVFRESLVGTKYDHTHYRSSAAASSFSMSNSYTAGHGNFGSSNNISGNFLHDSSISMANNKAGCDALYPQFKEGNNFTAVQENDNAALWDYVYGSRNTPNVPDAAYQSLLRQNNQLAGYQQGHQTLQLQEDVGYTSIYGSQTGIAREHQQQSLSNLILSGSQGSSSQKLPQIWQHSY